MAKLASIFGTNQQLEKEGVWIEIQDPGAGEPARIKIARAGGTNDKLAKVADEKWKPYRQLLTRGLVPPDVERKVIAEIYAESVVLDWQNVEDEDGHPIPFTPAACAAMMLALPDFLSQVMIEAKRLDNFRAEERASDTKA